MDVFYLARLYYLVAPKKGSGPGLTSIRDVPRMKHKIALMPLRLVCLIGGPQRQGAQAHRGAITRLGMISDGKEYLK